MRTLLLIAIFVSGVSVLFAQSPGNVSGSLIWWVKADGTVRESDGTTAETGDLVENWDDNAAGDIDAIVGTLANFAGPATRPIYRTNVINTNPALEFDGTKLLDGEAVSGIGVTESFNMFMVFKQNSYQTNGGTQDGAGTFIIDRPTATLNLTSFKVVDTDKYFYQRRQDDNSNLGGPVSVTPVNTSSFVIAESYRNTSTTREGIYLNGRLDIDQAGIAGNILGPPIRIGRHATNATGGLDGYFAEMIIYNTNLSTANRRRVESYLAIKYGITLNQTTLTDYVRSDGTVIYPAASTGSYSTYINDIAGIGQDDNSGLDQTDSRSQNTNYVVRISNPDDLDDGNFLVWGSNGGSLTSPNTSDVAGIISRRLSRVWRVAESGNVGTVTVAFDLSAVPGAKVGADLRLMIDANGAFNAGATYFGGTLAGSIFTVTGVNFTTGDYFTVGSVNASTTPLPIDLVDFNVTYESPVVVASWNTASELNNDFFTLERAGTDLQFEKLDTISGAGTSTIPHAYIKIDPNPYEGRSYYRLSQTDFDGTVTYFSPKSISIEETQKKLSAFPNPNDGRIINFRWGNSKFNLNHVEVINQQGKTLETLYIESVDLREYSIELKNRLSPGLYILKVYYNGKDEFVKLVVR